MSYTTFERNVDFEKLTTTIITQLRSAYT